MVPEQYTKTVKGNKSTVWLHFIPKYEIIFVCTTICLHLLFKVYVSPKYRTVFQISVLVLYRFIFKGTHPYL